MNIEKLINYLKTLPSDQKVNSELLKDIENMRNNETIACDLCGKIVKNSKCAGLEAHKFYKHGIKENPNRKWM